MISVSLGTSTNIQLKYKPLLQNVNQREKETEKALTLNPRMTNYSHECLFVFAAHLDTSVCIYC